MGFDRLSLAGHAASSAIDSCRAYDVTKSGMSLIYEGILTPPYLPFHTNGIVFRRQRFQATTALAKLKLKGAFYCLLIYLQSYTHRAKGIGFDVMIEYPVYWAFYRLALKPLLTPLASM